MNKSNSIKLEWSAYNSRTGAFDKLSSDPKLSESENNDYYIDNASSVSVFTDDKSQVPELMEHMATIRETLEWKGDIDQRVCRTFEDKRGRKIEGRVQVFVNRDVSTKSAMVGFLSHIAGMAR